MWMIYVMSPILKATLGYHLKKVWASDICDSIHFILFLHFLNRYSISLYYKQYPLIHTDLEENKTQWNLKQRAAKVDFPQSHLVSYFSFPMPHRIWIYGPPSS